MDHKKLLRVRIDVIGGVAEVVHADPGVIVEIRDYDVDDLELGAERPWIKVDAEGDTYCEVIVEGEPN